MKFLTLTVVFLFLHGCASRYEPPQSGPIANITYSVPSTDESEVYDRLSSIQSLRGGLGVYEDYSVCREGKFIDSIKRGTEYTTSIIANSPVTLQTTLSISSQDYSRGYLARNVFTFVPKAGSSYLITSEIGRVYSSLYFDAKTIVTDLENGAPVLVAQRKFRTVEPSGCVRLFEEIPVEEYVIESNSVNSTVKYNSD